MDEVKMEIIKKLFNFNDDNSSIIGLCRFNDEFFKPENAKEQIRKKLKKEASLTEILKKSAY